MNRTPNIDDELIIEIVKGMTMFAFQRGNWQKPIEPHELIEYTTAIKTLLANKIKEAELRGRIDEINRWFDMPKRYKGEEYRDEPFAKVKCKTPGRTQYYTLDSRFNWALADRLETLAALERSDPTHQPQTIQGRRNQ